MGADTTTNPEELIRTRRADLEALCRRYAVRRLRHFGSAVSGAFDPQRSDLDFLVEFDVPVGMNRFDQFFGLREELTALFDRRVDLVDSRAAQNPYFRKQAEAEAVELYAA
jgi:predicted nucleotidyltransferase